MASESIFEVVRMCGGKFTESKLGPLSWSGECLNPRT